MQLAIYSIDMAKLVLLSLLLLSGCAAKDWGYEPWHLFPLAVSLDSTL